MEYQEFTLGCATGYKINTEFGKAGSRGSLWQRFGERGVGVS